MGKGGSILYTVKSRVDIDSMYAVTCILIYFTFLLQGLHSHLYCHLYFMSLGQYCSLYCETSERDISVFPEHSKYITVSFLPIHVLFK